MCHSHSLSYPLLLPYPQIVFLSLSLSLPHSLSLSFLGHMATKRADVQAVGVRVAELVDMMEKKDKAISDLAKMVKKLEVSRKTTCLVGKMA